MTHYYIFKTNNLTGKTTHICNGSHDTERECRIHWMSYMYGFMDGAFEILGRDNFQMMEGSRPSSFRFSVDGKMNVEYFMLLDEAGEDMIMEICKSENNQ